MLCALSMLRKEFALRIFPTSILKRPMKRKRAMIALVGMLAYFALPTCAPAQEATNPNAPAVTKVEPPNWWLGITPDLMVLLAGRHLAATHVACNMPGLLVSRTQSSAGGNYLFVWLKFGPDLKSGTAVCRITTPDGAASFELPLQNRQPTLRRFQGLSQDDVLYLIVPDRFANGDPTNDEPPEAAGSHDRSKPFAFHGGDFRGIREHLPYLKNLGVTALSLTPIVKSGSAQDYAGHSAADLYAVEPHFGTLQDYADLVAAAHKNGLKVFLDIGFNDVSPRHSWVANPPLPDWFHSALQSHLDSSFAKESFYGKEGKQSSQQAPLESLADPHAPPSLTRNLTQSWLLGKLPDLNTENHLVAQYLLQNSIWWAEISGLDGFRLDTFPSVSRPFWEGWHAGLHGIYPRLSTIGQVYHSDPSVASFFAGGRKQFDGIDSGVSTVLDYPLYTTLRDVLLEGAPVGRIADVLRHDSLYVRPEELVTFFGNENVARFRSVEGSSLAKLKLAFGLLLTLRGIPEMYYGDEIGIPGGVDPDSRRDFSGGWPGDVRNSFTPDGRTPEQQAVFSYVQSLLQLRSAHPALRQGRLWHLASDESSYVFGRQSEEETVLVAFNNSEKPRELRISLVDTPVQSVSSVSSLLGGARAELAGHEMHINMPPQSLSIFVLN
jgi:neopullulanase